MSCSRVSVRSSTHQQRKRPRAQRQQGLLLVWLDEKKCPDRSRSKEEYYNNSNSSPCLTSARTRYLHVQGLWHQSLRSLRPPMARERKLRSVPGAYQRSGRRRGQKSSCHSEANQAVSELLEKHREGWRMSSHVLHPMSDRVLLGVRADDQSQWSVLRVRAHPRTLSISHNRQAKIQCGIENESGRVMSQFCVFRMRPSRAIFGIIMAKRTRTN